MKSNKLRSISVLFTAAILFSSDHFATAQSMAAAQGHSIFVCAGGQARATGWNPNGQLGNGTTTGSMTPQPVNGLSGVVATASRDQFTLFLLSDSTVWATGYNANGQFGNGTTTSTTLPVQIPNLTGVTKMATGYYHSLFLKSDSTVWSCGRNFSGELGDGTQIQRDTPVQVTSLSGVVDIAAGDGHSMFLLSDSTVWSCGDNQNGCLGLGNAPMQIINPTQVTSISGVKSIAGGFRHSLFIKHDGTAWASGYNNEGQLGDGTNIEKNTPVQVINLTGIVDASAGLYHSLFLKGDGTAWGVGYNAYGQLGNGANISLNIPVQVGGLTGITKVAASSSGHSLFLKNDNTFWGCGQNNVGQLGNGTNSQPNIPVLVLDSCSITSSIYDVTHNLPLEIYPNPSNGIFNLKFPGNFSIVESIEIYNLSGKIIYSGKITGSDYNLDLSTQSKGIYFYKIKDNDQFISTGKIIIN